MIKINENISRLPGAYLFSEVARRVDSFMAANPGADVIKMGIGDVTRPLCPAAIEAMHRAVDDLASGATFRGYGPEQGYEFLRRAIAVGDYHSRGVDIAPDEIFISDGAKSDLGNIGDILRQDCRIGVTDPVYPVYVDTAVMAGRGGTLGADGRWSDIVYIPCNSANGFVPALPTERVDAVYLCYPNNPTGTVLTAEQLAVWVDWAIENRVLILFDSAYEAFIRTPGVPHSIYEIERAREVAIEFRSFSKTAGFTGVRCGYTVVPRALKATTADGVKVALRDLWNRRQCTKFNGASYVAQRGAEAVYTPHGANETAETVDYYLGNAAVLLDWARRAGVEAWGGTDSPYIWLKTPGGMPSWDYFQLLLEKCHVVGTPGCGFGPEGEGYLRLTAFNTRENTIEAARRLTKLNNKTNL